MLTPGLPTASWRLLGTLPLEEVETDCALAPPPPWPPVPGPLSHLHLALGWVPLAHMALVACGPGALSPGVLSGPGGLIPALEVQVRFLGQRAHPFPAQTLDFPVCKRRMGCRSGA